ncbi:MAG: ribonuclease III [Rhizobiaceae bacterium]
MIRKPVDEAAVHLTRVTGHRFADIDRLKRALTHSSARKASAGSDYERLEFLGDRVLGLLVAEMLFARFPDATEGELSLRLNALVNAETCAEVADDLGISQFVRTGAEIGTSAVAKLRNLRADIVEALIAAIYLEGGLDAVRPVIENFWGKRADQTAPARRDPKTALQEWAHRAATALPAYEILSREGPDHDPQFTVQLAVKGFAPTRAQGRSKREAEQRAATAMLDRENGWPE